MDPEVAHLHTYFLFPFSVDKHALLEDHRELWRKHSHWIDGLDEWIAVHQKKGTSPVIDQLGVWSRTPYTRFDLDSRVYQDMVFFHPIVRRVFFDTMGASGTHVSQESLLRCYTMPVGCRREPGKTLWLEAGDSKGRSTRLEITDLRLFLFANGIGILSIGVEAFHQTMEQALWINEMVRKVYPSSGRQVREGRAPNRMAIVLDNQGKQSVVAEERFESGDMIGFQPPLAKTIQALLYFADYERQEYEPVLDERMIVYTYIALDPASVSTTDYHSDEYRILLSRFLYVDRFGPGYRYDENFIRRQMDRQLYLRWLHQGTAYGFTSYSNITVTVGTFDCEEHELREGFLIHRMFDSRYYLMAIVALFYRATLLDFSERTALVSKTLFLDQADGRLTLANVRMATDLRAEFMHFSNYWAFSELANKDEEQEHFVLQCRQYRTDPTKREIEEEIEKLNETIFSFYQFRNTEAVNRLAMLSMIFGAGAVLTGFFGMNFGAEFGHLFFQPDARTLAVHYAALWTAILVVVGAVFFGVWVVAVNWQDYRDILSPTRRLGQPSSLKRNW